MKKPIFMLLAVLLSLPPLRLDAAAKLTASWGEKSTEPIGSFTSTPYGPYVRITYGNCPWSMQIPYILVADENEDQDHAKLRESIAQETKTREFDRASVISEADYYKQAAETFPQHLEIIEKEQAFVKNALSKRGAKAIACRQKDNEHKKPVKKTTPAR